MTVYTAARFVEYEIAQRAVVVNETRLFPQRVSGRRRDAADDDVADLALGVAANDMNDPGGAHERLSAEAGEKV